MAGDWIKFETVTPDKPEVYELAGLLNLDPDAVVGSSCGLGFGLMRTAKMVTLLLRSKR